MAALIGVVVGIPSLRIKGPLSRHRHAREPADHRVDHQPHPGYLRRRPGLHRGAASDAVRGRCSRPRGSSTFFLLFFAVLAIVATLNLVRSRIGRAFVAIRDQDIAAEIIGINIFRYKLLVVRDLVLLRRRVRRALHLLLRHRQLRGVPDRRLDRLSGDDHHRRTRLGARLDPRRHLRDHAADRHPLAGRGASAATSSTSASSRASSASTSAWSCSVS